MELSRDLGKRIPLERGNDKADRAIKKVKNRENSMLGEWTKEFFFNDVLLSQALAKNGDEGLDEFKVKEEDVCFLMEAETLTVAFFETIQSLMVQAMRKTLVVWLLGKGIGYRTLYNHTMALWRP